jgi:hypothetical protein
MLGSLLPMVANGDVAKIAQNGSPMLMNAAGRLLGLGDDERAALARGKVPWWVWTIGGLALGFYAGVQVYKRYPEKIPSFVKGER